MNALTLDKVTLRGSRAVEPRKRALRRLERVDLASPGAPSEILIVRSLADPAPGTLARTGISRVVSKWESAAAQALASMRDRALRPRLGDASDAADAVLFADEAEMIACLAERLAAGHRPGWWARAVMRRLPPSVSVGTVLTLQGHLVAPVIATLIVRDTILPVMRCLTEADSSALAPLVGLPSVQNKSNAPTDSPKDPIISFDTVRSIPCPRPLRQAIALLPVHAARILAAAWLQRTRTDLATTERKSLSEAIVASYRSEVTTVAPVPKPPRKPSDAQTIPGSLVPTNTPEHEKPVAEQPEVSRQRQVPKPNDLKNRATQTAINPSETNSGPTSSTNSSPQPEPLSMQPKGSTDPTLGAAIDGVETALGGVFFLVNIFVNPIRSQAPEVAAAIDAAAQPDDGKWTAIERLARAAIGEVQCDSDALWPLLAQLDGRDDATNVGPAPADHRAANTTAQWLARQLGDGTPLRDLLACSARVHVTPAHIDIMLPAKSINIAVRRAGLDLDPGWQPRFGRIIAFHYIEQESSL